MSQDLRDLQTAAGAQWGQEGTTAVPLSFGNDELALAASQTGVALADRSHWGRIRVSDDDRLQFLHNQSTNDFKKLKPGQGCDTVILTSTARTIDLVTAYVGETDVLLLASPNRGQQLISFLDKYIFFSDKVKLEEVTAQTFSFSLIGPESTRLLEQWGATVQSQPYASHQSIELAGARVLLAVGSGLASVGYTLMGSADRAGAVWQALVLAGAVPLGEHLWQRLRIEQGRPQPDRELTEDHNPLEAGLWHTISFNKGCYIGQETIARLDTYKGVKQQLWGVRLPSGTELGSPVWLEDEKIGQLTSVVETEQGAIGLAYIRTKAGGAGLQVRVGELLAEVVEVPFLTREKSL